MREPKNCQLEYCGYKNPKTFEEIQFEILGLKNLIKRAEERISTLEQSAFIANLAIKNNIEDISKLFEGNQDD